MTFSSFASENTPESTAGEHPFATIAFGKMEGEDVYARLGDEPFIVAVRASLLDNIFADPLQWQELAIFRFKPDEVHKLTVTTDRELALTRNEKNEWQGSEPLNTVNIQSLLNTTTALRAVRWAGATTPAHGVDKPQVTIMFTTSPDDKSAHKLLVGALSRGRHVVRPNRRTRRDFRDQQLGADGVQAAAGGDAQSERAASPAALASVAPASSTSPKP